MEKEYSVRLLSKRTLAKENVMMTFQCQEIANMAKPGQFVNISCDHFLKRPFGICEVDSNEGTFSIGVRVVGDGTREITQAEIGDVFDVLGPLGNGFAFEGVKKIIAVGGGTGIYPLYFVLTYAKRLGIPVSCINGFRSREDAFLIEECEKIACRALFSTDSGDYGIKGNVMDALAQLSEEELSESTVFVVGPEIMMKKVSEWATEKSLTCKVSQERKMACGIGICLVCTCKVKARDEAAEFHHVRCCKEGPVMDAKEVIW